ncbi:MAG: hypothetical protein AAB116_13790, partial [Candidatus Poribacteria bacterium]
MLALKRTALFLCVLIFLSVVYVGSESLRTKNQVIYDSAVAATASPLIEPNIFVNLSKKLIPSVVNISTFSTVKGQFFSGGPDDLWRRFFEDMFRQHGRRGDDNGEDEKSPPKGGPGHQGVPRAMSLGTGFIIDSSGLILT